MANDSVSVSGPVKVVSDSPHRVALDLAQQIDYFSELDSRQKDRNYWLTLYSQCLHVVHGRSVSSALKDD